MTETDVVIMGKRGEILPKRHLRETSGIKPGDRLLIQANSGKLIIRKILSVDEALELPPLGEFSAEEAEKIMEKESTIQEELID